jgi:Fe-S cluster assembly ATP-binding protein
MNFLVKNLKTRIGKKSILKDINFSLKSGDVLAIIGSNGSGKTTLFKSIMKHFSLNVTGSIIANKTELIKKDTYEISKHGIFYIPQNSLELEGMQTLNFFRVINTNNHKKEFSELYKNINSLFDRFNLPQELLTRDLNVNFSGGQKKKIELIQSAIFNGKILLIDEIDSGVDQESIKEIASYINEIKSKSIILIISHNNYFLNLINPNKVMIINDGGVVKNGNSTLLKTIEKKGYKQFIKSDKKVNATCLTKKH